MKPKTKKKSKLASGSLSGCYLEHAARETAWAAEYSKQCKYQAAANALERRCPICRNLLTGIFPLCYATVDDYNADHPGPNTPTENGKPVRCCPLCGKRWPND